MVALGEFVRNYILAAVACWAVGMPALAQADGDAPFRAYDEGRYVEALAGAEEALAESPENSVWWALAAEARAKLSQHQGAAGAFAQAARFESDSQKRSYFLRAQALNLAQAGMQTEARDVLREAMEDPALNTGESLDWAMVAIAVGNNAAAQEILGNETLYRGFTRQSALDAGYSAKRLGLDRRAVDFFERGLELDAQEDQPFSAAERLAIRRETRELRRRWSFIAQQAYSSAGRPSGISSVPPGEDEVLQFGGEVARRIGGWRNGRPISVFARVFHSESLTDDLLSGSATQGWLGVRVKPLAQLNLNLEASRLIALDGDALDDWSLRSAISGGQGLEPEAGMRRWFYAHYYGDLSYLTEADVVFGLAEGRAGYSVLFDQDQTVLTPYAVVRGDLDTGRIKEQAFGAGAGLTLRYWFDESESVAYRGFVDFDIQARQHIAGDRRASGVLATITVGR